MTHRPQSNPTATTSRLPDLTPEKRVSKGASKAPCLCGCAGITSLWRKKVTTSPEFKKQIEQGVKFLLEKARHVRKFGRQISTLDTVSKPRNFVPPLAITSTDRLTRLQTLMQILQGPDFFALDSGSYPASRQWTSAVLTTLLIDYSHLTVDHQYFSHIVSLFNYQDIYSLLGQKNDDKLWVALTYLRGATYAAIHDEKWVEPFLERASLFYNSASAGWDDANCGGGMYWGQGCCSKYKNAVTTELWITASVGMYDAFGDESMLEAAIRGWVWFEKSGMINDQGLVNDGLDRNCRNNGKTTWTYNQGIILSGLSGLYKYTEDYSLIAAAQNLIDSVLASKLVPMDSGVLVESCDPTRTCDQDQWMFKGVFFEHLGYFLADMAGLDELQISSKIDLVQKYSDFINANANAVWDVARGEDGKVGSWWGGPPRDQTRRHVKVETHGSGVAAVCCAVRVDLLLESLEQANIDGQK